MEVDGAPVAIDATLRHFRGGHAGLLAEALEQPLLLSLKRDLAIVSYSAHLSFIYVYLHFITEVTLLLHVLGHATSFHG